MASEASAKHPLAGKRIVVAGAGVAGLSFIRALDRNWDLNAPRPQLTLYERCEKQALYDQKGYSIGIRSDKMSGGLQALQSLGILDEALSASITGRNGRPGGSQIWDREYNTIMRRSEAATPPDGLPVNSMRIRRNVLCRVLIDSLPTTTDVRWNLGVSSARTLSDGRMEVTLTDGSTDECDFLVAADGANSKIRGSLRPHDTLQYAGATMIMGTSRMPEGLPKHLQEVATGIALSGDGHFNFNGPVDDKTAVWSLSFRSETQREVIQGKAAKAACEQILNEVHRRGAALAQTFHRLVEGTDPSTLRVFNTMDKQPIKHSELGSSRVVFVGDANHAMSPFAGNGANLALTDGVDLAVELCRPQQLESLRKAFDAKSVARSKKSITMSHILITMGHSTGWRLYFFVWFLRIFHFLKSFF